MTRLCIVEPVAPTSIANDGAAEPFFRRVVSKLVPHLQDQVGPLYLGRGDDRVVMWTTEGWLEDGTMVTLAVRVGESEISLALDTAPVLVPERRLTSLEKVGLVLALSTGGVGAWFLFRSILAVIGGVVVGAMAHMIVEALLANWKKRRSMAHAIDEDTWRARLREAIRA